jgi:hypothetical protein
MKRDRALGFYRRRGFAIVDEIAHELSLRFEPKPALRGNGPSMGMRRG